MKMANREKLIANLEVSIKNKNSWNYISITCAETNPYNELYFRIFDADGFVIGSEIYLRRKMSSPGKFFYTGTVYLFSNAEKIGIFSFNSGPKAFSNLEMRLTSTSRLRVSSYLLRHMAFLDFWKIARSLPNKKSPLLTRLRRMLALASRDAGFLQRDYTRWIRLFDQPTAELAAQAKARPSIAYLVFSRDGASAALEATLRSLTDQLDAPEVVVFASEQGAEHRMAIETVQADYVGILQAGEVLPLHATRWAAAQLQDLGRPEIAITDDDSLEADGRRHDPRFKPTPNRALMLSGTLSRGLWLIQRSALMAYEGSAAWAEELRLGIWLERHRMSGDGFSARIPFILSHRRSDAETAPAAILTQHVARDLEARRSALSAIAAMPITFRLTEGKPRMSVTAIVPSTLRKPDSLRCILAMLENTDHPRFDMHVVVMQSGPLDEAQAAAASRLQSTGRIDVTWVQAAAFNFSAANNAVAQRVRGDGILLLNDDVAPIRPDWLRWMGAFLEEDARIGAVGARLLYGDDTVQHGGVIIGLAGLCDHAHRYLPAADPGYMARATLAQELSAVTAACMLVRRSLYERLQGLDEAYPSAFNDVDFCLRIREAGHGIVYAAQAELHHYESQTYGSHYAGDREAFYEEEVQRMKRRWADVVADDPFHNPNLGLAPGAEWSPAFPPRTEAPAR